MRALRHADLRLRQVVHAPAIGGYLREVISWFAISALPIAGEPIQMSPMWVEARKDPSAGQSGIASLASITPLEPSGDSLSNAFQEVPGLIVQDSFGGFDPPRIGVRGSGIQSAPSSRGLIISFLGMPLNAADGSFNSALLESAWLDSAWLIRGPAAGVPALGGSLALGSAAEVFAPGYSMQMGYGSYDQFSLAADGAGRRGEFDLAGRAAFSSIGGWRPHSEQQRESWLAASRSVLDNGWDLTVQLMAARPQYEVPGPLTLTTALNDPTATVPAVVRDDPRRETEYVQLAARASRDWEGARVEFGLGGIYHDDLFYQLQANGVSDTEATEGCLSLRIERDWRAGHVWNLAKHHTDISALLLAGRWDARRYRNDGGHRGHLIGNHAMSPLTFATALDHQFLLTENQQLELGISTLSAQREMDDRLSPGAGGPGLDPSFAGTRLAPRAAWSWTPLDDTTLVVSYARSYEPPTYNDLLFTSGPPQARVLESTSLDWQRADSLEIATRGRLEWLEWSSAIYYSPWKGELLRLANDDGSSRGTVNAKRTLHTGWENRVEAKLLADASSQVTAWATYNLTHARFDDDPIYGDGRLAGVSPHTGALGLRAVFPDGWYIAPGCQWRAGDTYGDHARTLSYGGTALWSLELGRRHPDGWSVSLGIHNLFDRRAIASTAGVLERAPAPQSAAIFLPSAGRTVELRCGFEW